MLFDWIYTSIGPSGLPYYLQLVWEVRWDIQKRINIYKGNGKEHFLTWWLLEGNWQHKNLSKNRSFEMDLFQGLFSTCTDSRLSKSPKISYLQFYFWESRPDLVQYFDIFSLEGLKDFLSFFYVNDGWKLLIKSDIPREHLDIISEAIVKQQGVRLERCFWVLIRLRKSIREEFESIDANDPSAIESWKARVASKFFPKHPKLLRALGIQLRQESVESEKPSFWNLTYTNHKQIKKGINLVGYARSPLGIGEDVRTCARALLPIISEVSVFEDFTPNKISRMKTPIDDIIDRNVKYLVNIFNMTAFDTKLFFTKVGTAFFENRINIGFWPWELDRWPESWNNSFDFVDEIWTVSTFIQRVIQKNTEKKVTAMPLGVAIPEEESITANREKFHLPKERFLFYFVFDFNSFLTRKNPEAVVDAFRLAFSKVNQNVGLVFKTSNFDYRNVIHKLFVEKIESDNRVFHVSQTLSSKELYEFVKSCDCLVSLHRAEGFGRVIAEAMLMGKPVVCTNYSGNTDFTKPNNSFLVDYKLVPIKEGEYHFCSKAEWADPDIDDAARQMNAVFSNRTLRESVAKRGKEFISTNYSLKAVGSKYYENLKQYLKV